jgi:hypothetical protein
MKIVRSSTKVMAVVLCCGTLAWVACTKNNSGNNSPSTTSVSNTSLIAQGDASADASFENLTNNILTTKANGESLGAVDDSTSSFRQATAQAYLQSHVTTFGPDSSTGTVTITVVPETPGVFPKTVTINFGSGFTDWFGNTYSGSISTVFTGVLSSPGASATTTFDNYTFDSVEIAGTHVITNTSKDSVLSFSIQVQNAKVTIAGGFFVNWNATRDWAMIAGASTPRWPFDDVYSVTGSSSGSTSNNFTWTSTIETPLTRAYICPWFESGTVKIVTNYGTGVLDFGSGGCDNQATITVGDSTRTITLGR